MSDEPASGPKPTFVALFGHFVQGIADLRAFIELALEGLGYATIAPEIIARLRKSYERDHKDHPLLDDKIYSKSIATATELQDFAKGESDRKFPYLYGLATMKLYALIEALVHDLAVQVLVHSPTAWNSPAVQGVKGALVPFERLPIQARAETIVFNLRRELDTRASPGMGKLESLLSAVGLPGEVNPVVRRAFVELREVRNCLTHRYGYADARIAELCPWLGLSPGQAIPVDHSTFHWYSLAVTWYESDLWLRWLGLEPKHNEEPDYPQKLAENKLDFLELMRRIRPNADD